MEAKDSDSDHIIVLRFSALGDVAIAAPLLREVALRYPQKRFTMVSQPMMEPLFTGVPNLGFYPVYVKGSHKGVSGMFRLFRELRALKPTAVADIHSVLRTFILGALFTLSLIKVVRIRKGRAEKRLLTAREGKRMVKLPTSMRRYEIVLEKILRENIGFSQNEGDYKHPSRTNGYMVGVAPFARHKGKEWPIERMERVVAELSEDDRFTIILFGGGKREAAILKGWEQRYSGATSVAGEFSFERELEIIEGLNLMICMDSANMHFASYKNIPVLSVWGATHPFLGFYGWGQREDMALMAEADCRPCSVFGNKECYRGDYICMNNLLPEDVIHRVYNFFGLERR